MYEYDEECLQVFLENQSQLFDEPVAETPEEAEAFLEECMAVVVDSIEEVAAFFREEGIDMEGYVYGRVGRGFRSVRPPKR